MKQRSQSDKKKKILPKNGTKKVIGLDLDGVILDHTRMRIKLAKKYGYSLQPRHTPSELLKKKVPAPYRQLIQYFIYTHPDFSQKADLIPQIRTALQFFKKSGYPVYLISRRREGHLAVDVLKKRGLWPDYFNEKNSFFVATPEEKNEKAKALGVTHYVDDEMRILAVLQNVKNKFLLDFHGVLKKGEYIRVKSWPELIKKLSSV